MTFQQIKDERVEQAKHKIHAELMQISYLIIVVSFCVKSIYFNMNLRQCATEFLILILAPLYQSIRSRQMDVVFGDVKTAWWRQMLPVLVVVVFLFGLVTARSYMNGKPAWVSANLSAGFLFLLIYLVIFAAVRFLAVRAERRRANRLEHQYDEED